MEAAPPTARESALASCHVCRALSPLADLPRDLDHVKSRPVDVEDWFQVENFKS